MRDQPRVPAGNPDGGQWTDAGGGGNDGGRVGAVAAALAPAVSRVPGVVAQRVAASAGLAGGLPGALATAFTVGSSTPVGSPVAYSFDAADGSRIDVTGRSEETARTLTLSDRDGRTLVLTAFPTARGIVATDGHAIVDGEPQRLPAADLIRTWNRFAGRAGTGLAQIFPSTVNGGNDGKPDRIGTHPDGKPIYRNDNGGPPLDPEPDDEDPDPGKRPRHDKRSSATLHLAVDAVAHIVEGEINRRGRAVGGHSLDSTSLRVLEVTKSVDANGVIEGRIEIYDYARNIWVEKRNVSSFFPADWSAERIATQIEAAYSRASRVYLDAARTKWQARSPSGIKIEGYIDNFDNITTAYPLHGE